MMNQHRSDAPPLGAASSAPPKPSPAQAVRSHRLRSAEVVGGFLDGMKVEFADGLNCLIGHRGTGKTTILEFVRYALDAFPETEAGASARKRVENLVRNNLGDGRIRLRIETKDGLEYLVDRTVMGDPIALTPDGQPTDISLRCGGLFKADIYSQNEVENIADNPLSQLVLIDNFVAEQVEGVNAQIMQVEADLVRNANSIVPLQMELARAGDELSTLPAVEAKLEALAVSGGENAQELNAAHSHKAMRDRERQAVDAASEWIHSYTQYMQDSLGKFNEHVHTLFAPDMLAGPNGQILKMMMRSLIVLGDGLDGLFHQMVKLIADAQGRMDVASAKLLAAHKPAGDGLPRPDPEAQGGSGSGGGAGQLGAQAE